MNSSLHTRTRNGIFHLLIFSDNGLKIIPNTSCEAQPYLNVDMKIINFYSGSAVIPR